MVESIARSEVYIGRGSQMRISIRSPGGSYNGNEYSVELTGGQAESVQLEEIDGGVRLTVVGDFEWEELIGALSQFGRMPVDWDGMENR